MVLKVLHINCNYTGTTLHQAMIEHLDKQGIDNSVFVPVANKSNSIIDVNDNVIVSECFNKWDRILFQYKSAKIFRAVQQTYDIKTFDMVHAYTLFTDGNVAHELFLKYGIPYVVAVRNTDVNSFFKYMIHLRNRGISIMKDAKAIIFLSESYKEFVFDRYVPKRLHKELNKKCHIVPNGIDDFWHTNAKTGRIITDVLHRFSQKKLRLIYAGGINKNKNTALTLKAINLLVNDGWNVEFIVVGKNKDDFEFKKILHNPYVKYYTARPKEQLIELYRMADVFVMPSHKETFGLVYAEAMTQGLPVIYTKGQGFDKQFAEGTVGYNVNSDDHIELQKRILDIVSNYSIITENCERFSHKFNWKDICIQYVRIYRDICYEKQ